MFSKAVRGGESGESRCYREQVSGIARDGDESGREGSNDRHGARGVDSLPEKPRGQDQRVRKPAVVHAYCPAQRVRHPGPPAPTNGTHSCERMERRMEIVEEVLHTTRGDMLMLRQWLSSLRGISHAAMASVSNRGLVAFPPEMENRLRNKHFWVSAVWSSEDHGGGGDGDRHHRHRRHPPVPVNYTTYHYLLKQTNDAYAAWLQSQVPLLCDGGHLNNHDNSRNRTDVRIISGSLLMICNLWNYELMLSSVEGDMLWGLQRSWVQEKRLAVERIRRSMHLDAEYVAQLAWDAYQMVEKGGGNGDRDTGVVLPEYMH